MAQPQGQYNQGFGMQPQPVQGQPGAPPPNYGQPGAQPGVYTTQQGYAGPPAPPGPPGQPAGPVWMPKPEAIPGVPPGLEYLTSIDQLLVHQQVELLEAFTSWETKNRYQVKNSLGQQIFFAAEESDTCMRQCCGPQRGFVMHITDNFGQEVIRVTREFKCCAGCSWCACAGNCCAFEIAVEAPVGTVVGYVRQAFWKPKYEILDANRDVILAIEGPCCICQGLCCTWDQEFKIQSADRTAEVGKISKQWSGFAKEMFTQADNFGVSFPVDLDVRTKATCLGAVFLIDFMYFEKKQNNNNHN